MPTARSANKRRWDSPSTPGPDVIDPLLSALKDPDAQVREKAAIGLAFRRDPKIVEPLLAAMEDSDSQVREKAAIALGASGDERAVGALTKAMKDPDSQVREKAVAGLVLLGTAQMILAAALAAQVALAPCKIEGVPGEARCGSHKVWEDREAKQGRQIDLVDHRAAALEPNKLPDPFFMLAGRTGRRAVVQRALLQPRLPRHPPVRATSCSSICAAPASRRRCSARNSASLEATASSTRTC